MSTTEPQIFAFRVPKLDARMRDHYRRLFAGLVGDEADAEIAFRPMDQAVVVRLFEEPVIAHFAEAIKTLSGVEPIEIPPDEYHALGFEPM
ncbi:MAG: hypothetical protein HYY85_12875 [Deltaproteobacteria bacterium]|nr:hypothetical protein [Deltaproteobacteria bacterium]